jgi:hypothetical protein
VPSTHAIAASDALKPIGNRFRPPKNEVLDPGGLAGERDLVDPRQQFAEEDHHLDLGARYIEHHPSRRGQVAAPQDDGSGASRPSAGTTRAWEIP